MNTIQKEQLFTELTFEEAAVIEGGVQFCPYTTQGVDDWLNIRRTPDSSRNDNIVGRWNPGEVKLLESPAIVRNGFRAFNSSRNRWVSTRYIKRAGGLCAQ